MSNTLTVRLPEELLERLREKFAARPSVGRVVRESLETALSKAKAKTRQSSHGESMQE